jgi:hypothetical protein
MKLRILAVSLVASGLALVSTAASAKGLEDVTVSGPGLASAIRLTDASANELARKSGFFGQTPDRVTADPPAGFLGPRYAVTYRFALNELTLFRQDLYPFAVVGPLTYTPPRQATLNGMSRGGWSRAGPELTLLLVAAGVPVPAAYAAPVPVAAEFPLAG